MVDAITNAAYVSIYPTEKCANPTNLACTIDNATGLSFHLMKLANGVLSWAQARVSNNSCQYPRQDIKNINPVAHTKCPNKNIQAHTDKLFIP